MTPPGQRLRASASTSLDEVELKFGECELLEKVRPMQLQPRVLRAQLEFKKRRLRNQHAAKLQRATPPRTRGVSGEPIDPRSSVSNYSRQRCDKAKLTETFSCSFSQLYPEAEFFS
jgi:hypothetical protein